MAASLPDESKLKFKPSRKLMMVSLGLIVVGVLLTVAAALTSGHHGGGEGGHGGGHNPNRFWFSMHLALLVALPLGLGGIYFTAFNHVAGAAWSVIIRRIAENYFWFLGFVFIFLAIVLFFGHGDVFGHWVHPKPNDELILHKAPYLNPEGAGNFPKFFVFRNLIIVAVWFVLGFLLWKRSTTQDNDGSLSHTRGMVKLSAGFLVFFALSYSMSSWDLSMSLEPHWFSTMWAVYIFAGLALITFASLILWVWYLKGNGYYGDALNENHFHDLGKFMWGHTIFWAYVGIASQFLLIWYAHIPEETGFYHYRLLHMTKDGGLEWGSWAPVSLALVLVRFILPFFLIIRRDVKRKLGYMAAVSAFILFGQILDMYWVLFPTLTVDHHRVFTMFSWQELGPLAMVAGSYILITAWGLSRASLVPKKDPRLEECLHWHQ